MIKKTETHMILDLCFFVLIVKPLTESDGKSR